MHMSRQPTGTPNIPRCRLSGAAGAHSLLLLGLLLSGLLLSGTQARSADTGWRDPEFARIPFDKWPSESKSQIHWTVTIRPADLSTHQRLILRVTLRVDGKDVYKRRGNRELLALIQYRDAAGNVWQNHKSIDLANLRPAVQSQYLDTTFYAFVLPGDYTVKAAVCDSSTLEHSVTVRKVHVDPLKTDPLAGSWTGLPNVDLVPPTVDPPEVWFLPDVTTRLNLQVPTKKPVHVHVLLNTTPSQRAAGSVTAMRANMSLLIPALKIFSAVDLPNGSLDAELLDLTHRRVTFEQKNVHELDWPSIQKFFAGNRPGIIDAATLQGQWKMRKFFWDEVSRKLEPGTDGAVPVVIVLSGPAFMEDQEPVEPSNSQGEAQRRLFYIRYRAQQQPGRGNGRANIFGGTMMGRGSARMQPMMPPPDPDYIPPMPVDDLEHTVEPLNARLFDAASTQQFRRVLAAILEQISRM